MVLVVVVPVTEALDAAVFTAGVVVPDSADRHVAARLHDFEMNVVLIAAIASSLLRYQMHLAIVTRHEIYRSIDVEHVHPPSCLHAAVPAPGVRIAAVLLLRADSGRCEQ